MVRQVIVSSHSHIVLLELVLILDDDFFSLQNVTCFLKELLLFIFLSVFLSCFSIISFQSWILYSLIIVVFVIVAISDDVWVLSFFPCVSFIIISFGKKSLTFCHIHSHTDTFHLLSCFIAIPLESIVSPYTMSNIYLIRLFYRKSG